MAGDSTKCTSNRACLVAQLVKNLQCGRPGFHPWVGKIPWRRAWQPTPVFLGFPGGSAGKEPTCSAGDLGSISGLGRSLGGEHGNPLQYSWASLVAQLVRNPHAVWETWVPSLGEEDPLEEGMATHSSTFAWRIPWIKEPGGLQSMQLQRVRHDRVTKHSTAYI